MAKICVGGKWCAKANCRERCKSWFSQYPDIERACRNACGSNQSFTKDEFRCSGKYIDEATFIRAYGSDPCIGGATLESVLDPLNDREAQKEQFQDIAPFLWGILALILVALVVLYFLRK